MHDLTVVRESCEADSQRRNLLAFRKQRISLFSLIGELQGSKVAFDLGFGRWEEFKHETVRKQAFPIQRIIEIMA